MITNHGIHQWDVIPGLPDTGGQNVFVNQMTNSLVGLGFRATIVNRGGFPHPRSGGERSGLDYKDRHQRILFIEDEVKEFVRKEDMHEHIPQLVEFLGDFLRAEDMPLEFICSHYWDAASIGVQLKQSLGLDCKHVWIPHSVGTLKKRNVDPASWEQLRIDERIAAERELIPRLDGIGATSTSIRESLRDDYGVETDIFLPPCVDVQRIHPFEVDDDDPIWDFLAARSTLEASELRRRRCIFEVSRTDKTKRKDLLVEAFAKVHASHPDTLLLLTLDTDDESVAPAVKRLISEHGLSDDVILLGSVWEQLPSLYNLTSIYCTPSVMEGFGMSAQEAAATAVPVVASNLVPFAVEFLAAECVEQTAVEGAEEPVRFGAGGVICPANHADAFALALERLLDDRDLRKRMGRQAYEITIPKFTWEHMVTDFLLRLEIPIPGEQHTRHHLDERKLDSLLRSGSIERLSLNELAGIAADEEALVPYRPEGVCQIDPRSGDRVIYNAARARRPHDNLAESKAPAARGAAEPSIISQGKTTGVIDKAELSEGFTFINFNLFPILFPDSDGMAGRRDPEAELDAPPSAEPLPCGGYHLLQWTSSYEDRDWHNMPLDDRIVVLSRAAALERKLLEHGHGYVSLIKNCGSLVGGSIAQGHQQIGYSVVMPSAARNLAVFERRHGERFSGFLLRENPPGLVLRRFETGTLLVPYFMKRPYAMIYALHDTAKSHLHELGDSELRDASEAWHVGIRLIIEIMQRIDKELAYNVVAHTGPGAGIHFEFLPYSQETGGFEHLGLYVCQGTPDGCAELLQDTMRRWEEPQ